MVCCSEEPPANGQLCALGAEAVGCKPGSFVQRRCDLGATGCSIPTTKTGGVGFQFEWWLTGCMSDTLQMFALDEHDGG